MEKVQMIWIYLLLIVLSGCIQGNHNTHNQADNNSEIVTKDIKGKWLRMSPNGPLSLTFEPNGLAEADFADDGTIDAIASYSISGGFISFTDKELMNCEGTGKYKIYLTDHYMALDMEEDDCDGRIKTMAGYWVKPSFEETLASLTKAIEQSGRPEDHLARGRMYLALGRSADARLDFDAFLMADSTDARAYINRAASLFAYNELDGIVADTEKAITLEPNNKNAWFLRGLALYNMGQHQEACSSFEKAIGLGFSVLREAEMYKCAEYWNEK